MRLLVITLQLTQLSQVVLFTHGACEAAWSSISSARAVPARHGETGHALHAMLQCTASEHPQISWRARNASSAQAVPDTTDHPPDPAAMLTLWGNTIAAPLLVPCANSAQEHSQPEVVSSPAGQAFQHSPAGLVGPYLNVAGWCFSELSNAQGRSRQINWVISGGLGALGKLMAASLEHGGCGRLSLLSRSGHFNSQDNAMQHLLCCHTSVTMERCACAPLPPILPSCT